MQRLISNDSSTIISFDGVTGFSGGWYDKLSGRVGHQLDVRTDVFAFDRMKNR